MRPERSEPQASGEACQDQVRAAGPSPGEAAGSPSAGAGAGPTEGPAGGQVYRAPVALFHAREDRPAGPADGPNHMRLLGGGLQEARFLGNRVWSQRSQVWELLAIIQFEGPVAADMWEQVRGWCGIIRSEAAFQAVQLLRILWQSKQNCFTWQLVFNEIEAAVDGEPHKLEVARAGSGDDIGRALWKTLRQVMQGNGFHQDAWELIKRATYDVEDDNDQEHWEAMLFRLARESRGGSLNYRDSMVRPPPTPTAEGGTGGRTPGGQQRRQRTIEELTWAGLTASTAGGGPAAPAIKPQETDPRAGRGPHATDRPTEAAMGRETVAPPAQADIMGITRLLLGIPTPRGDTSTRDSISIPMQNTVAGMWREGPTEVVSRTMNLLRDVYTGRAVATVATQRALMQIETGIRTVDTLLQTSGTGWGASWTEAIAALRRSLSDLRDTLEGGTGGVGPAATSSGVASWPPPEWILGATGRTRARDHPEARVGGDVPATGAATQGQVQPAEEAVGQAAGAHETPGPLRSRQPGVGSWRLWRPRARVRGRERPRQRRGGNGGGSPQDPRELESGGRAGGCNTYRN